MANITIEMVDEVWGNFDKYKETAEQHEFIMIALLDLRLQAMYNDLHTNWSEAHALIFMRLMKNVSERFGFECPAFEEGE